MVGAVLVKNGEVIGRGWHHRAGLPHAEIEAIGDARRGKSPSAAMRMTRGRTLYVTLEPCSTQGRTPPCTDAIFAAASNASSRPPRIQIPRTAAGAFPFSGARGWRLTWVFLERRRGG